jgi:Arc/MetJ family transcription regulator
MPVCMRTNIDLDDALLREAKRYSRTRTRKALVEEALRVLIATRTAEEHVEGYRDRLQALEPKLAGIRLRRSPSEILREDRDRV